MDELYGIAFGWILGVWSYAIYKARPRQNAKVGTPSASHNRQSMPLRCPKCGNLLSTICEACHIVADNRG